MEKNEGDKKKGFSSWLNKMDDKAENKGAGRKTIWQVVKFLVVSLLVTIIQIALVNLLYFLMKAWKEPLVTPFKEVFTAQIMGEGHDNFGYVLPFFLSNFIANTVGYFLNKRKTFKSDAPIWHYVIYILVLFVLIVFSTWLQGLIANGLTLLGAEVIAPTIASMVAGGLQFLLLFPLQKYVLLREKKKEPDTDIPPSEQE